MARRLLPLLLVFALVSLLFACGGSSNNPPAGGTQNVVITIGDDPGAQIASFTVTVNPITLIPTSGDPVVVMNTPITIELTHLAGTAFPLGIVTIPKGTYKGAKISLSNPQMTMISPITGQPVTKDLPPGPYTVPVVFNPTITVGDTPAEIHFDVNVLGSITIDAAGTATFTPKVLCGPPPTPTDMPIPHFRGMVSNLGSSSFTLTTLLGQKALTFQVTPNTTFYGISGLGQMQTGMLVVVGANLASDGTLTANTVAASMMPGFNGWAIGMEGLVYSVNSDGSQFQMVFQGGIAPPMMMAANWPGMIMTVNVGSGTVFKIDTDGVDTTGLTLPAFNATTLKPGQRVRVLTTLNFTTGMMGTMPAAVVTANEVDLEQQALVGVVSDYTPTKFTLTVPADGAFATLSKTNTVTVYVQPQTLVKGTVANGGTVLVRGLLLNDNGTFVVVSTGVLVPSATT